MKRIEGDFVVHATAQEVLSYFGDFRNILPALPGLVEAKEATAEGGTVVIKVGVSFLKGRFTAQLAQTSHTGNGVRFRGHADGVGSAVDFEAGLDVASGDVTTTNVHWFGDVRVHGSLASVSAGLLTPIINQNVQLFAGNLKNGLESRAVQADTLHSL